jgi:hypothetical protein
MIFLALEDRCARGLGRIGCARSLLIWASLFRLLATWGCGEPASREDQATRMASACGGKLWARRRLLGLEPAGRLAGPQLVRGWVSYPGSEQRPSVISLDATGL